MTNRRLLKAAEAIREVVASAILTELRDPRVKDVTVLGVEVTPDMREAKVSVSIMGTEGEKRKSLSGLQNSAGFLQSKIANRIDSRYTPKLQFVLNKGAENAALVSELLAKINQEKAGTGAAAESDQAVDHEAVDSDPTVDNENESAQQEATRLHPAPNDAETDSA